MWEYKFVDAKYDRKAFEQTITQHGKEGWEFCSSEHFRQGEAVLVFKKRKGGDAFFGAGFGAGGMGGPGGMGGAGFGGWREWAGGAGLGGGAGGMEARVFTLSHAKADDVAAAITKAHPKAVKVTGEPRTNMVIVIADSATMKQIAGTIEGLDAKPGGDNKPKPGGGGAGGVGSPGPGFPGGMGMGVFGGKPSGELTVITLQHAAAADLEAVLKKVFPDAQVTAEARSNQLIVRADAKTMDELQVLIKKLDVSGGRPK